MDGKIKRYFVLNLVELGAGPVWDASTLEKKGRFQIRSGPLSSGLPVTCS